MVALAHGQVLEALKWNPLVVAVVLAIPLWFGFAWVRAIRPTPGAERSPRIPVLWLVTGIVILVVANWIYLIFSLPG